jgi:hypothetical protein
MVRTKIWNEQDYTAELANVRWQNTTMRLRIKEALNELGVPTSDYPSPIVNAVSILQRAIEDKS